MSSRLARLAWLVFSAIAPLLLPRTVAAEEPSLHIEFMVSSGAQRTAWVNIVDRFAAANPDLRVTNHESAQEPYKRDFALKLNKGDADLAFWFAGERLREMVDQGLLKPLNPEWIERSLDAHLDRSLLEAASVQGQAYGLPLSYYPWGFFYSKATFKRLDLSPPATWEELLSVCERLKTAHITPIAMGGREGWPLAAWFDYLDLRLNGKLMHQSLLRGEGAFDEARVRQVFEAWKLLLDRGYFSPDHASIPWDGAMPYLYHAEAGMTLMGSFIISRIPVEKIDDIGFFRFPRLNKTVPNFELLPLDILVLPSRSRHPAAARRFVEFLLNSSGIENLNLAEHTLSPRNAGISAYAVLDQSVQSVLADNAGYTLFFDRDIRSAQVAPALETFKHFMTAPHDVDAAVEGLRRALRNGTASAAAPR